MSRGRGTAAVVCRGDDDGNDDDAEMMLVRVTPMLYYRI